MKNPIVFIHKGNSFYLKYVLDHTKQFNENSELYLIGDATNDKYNFVNHVPIHNYLESAKIFSEHYSHMSTNNYEYELFCFQRWFILLDFLKSKK